MISFFSHRHGDRTPWTGSHCWPKDSSIWDCYLDSAEIPMYSDSQYGRIVPRVYRKGQYLVPVCDSHPMPPASYFPNLYFATTHWVFFFLNTVFQFGDEVLKGNCSVGQLTTIGFYQHLMNGYSLRKAYVDSGFLSKNLSRSEVYIRSDGMRQNVFVLFVSLSLLPSSISDVPRTQQACSYNILHANTPWHRMYFCISVYSRQSH